MWLHPKDGNHTLCRYQSPPTQGCFPLICSPWQAFLPRKKHSHCGLLAATFPDVRAMQPVTDGPEKGHRPAEERNLVPQSHFPLASSKKFSFFFLSFPFFLFFKKIRYELALNVARIKMHISVLVTMCLSSWVCWHLRSWTSSLKTGSQ